MRGRLGRRVAVALVGLLAALLAIVSWGRLAGAEDGLQISRTRLGPIPVTVFRAAVPSGPGAAPVVVIAHGFAGSQQLMLPFATTLARNGYTAVTFDFPGHGRNTTPMTGGLVAPEESQRTLLAALEQVGDFARTLSGGAGYALVGHSMASDLVVRHAQAHPDLPATVAVSLFAPSIDAATPPDSPRNLLVVVGALEPEMMAKEARRVVAGATGVDVGLRTTYGRFADGTARRMDSSPGVEHIGVLYSVHTQAAALYWLNPAFGRPTAQGAYIDNRGRWLGGLLLGVMGLAWTLSRALPRVITRPAADGPVRRASWRRAWPLAVVPAVVTPLVLWKLPSDFLPILLGDYLVLHFGLYGLLTAALLALTGHPLPRPDRGRRIALLVATTLVTAFAVLAIGVPVDRFVFNVHPEPARWPLIVAMWAGTLPYFLADEWFTRAPEAPRAAYLLSKLCFLLSLVIAIALNVQKLFFLVIIVPAILVLFVVYGLFSRWAFQRTGHPLAGALANGLAFGAFIGVTFPIVS